MTSLPKTIQIEIDHTWTIQQIKQYIHDNYNIRPQIQYIRPQNEPHQLSNSDIPNPLEKLVLYIK